jgi:hypothetical protein
MATTLRPLRRAPLVALVLAGALLAASLAGGCSRAKGAETVATLEAQIAQYRREPSDALAARIDASFARLDAEIAEIRADATTKTGADRTEDETYAEQLSERRAELRKDYYGARVESAAEAAKGAAKKLGESLGKGLEEAGEKLQDAVRGDDQPD